MQPQIIQWLSDQKIKIEIILVLLVILSFLLKISGFTGSDEALMISMTLLAGFYFLSAYFMVEMNTIMMVITLKIFSIASSVCIIGLLFAMLKLTGAQEMLLIGAASMGLATLGILYSAAQAWSSKYLPLLIRMVALGIITVNTLLKLLEQSQS